MTWTKLATLKNGKRSARGNQGRYQINLARPSSQGYFFESDEGKATTDKGDDAHGSMKPT
jgi:hypothetical protein